MTSMGPELYEYACDLVAKIREWANFLIAFVFWVLFFSVYEVHLSHGLPTLRGYV